MNCPRCDRVLLEARPDPTDFALHALQCRQCGGHWVEAADLARIEQTVDVQLVEFRHLPPPSEQQKILTCPRCRPLRTLTKVQSERDRKVVMDTCAQCQGTWLDGGELKAIQEKGLLSAIADAIAFVAKN